MKDDYKTLVEYWDKCFNISEEEKKGFKDINPDEDYKSLAPSQKQYDALCSFPGCKKVLDYGCGDGWASVILAKNGVKEVISADVAAHSYDLVTLYSKAFGTEDIIKPVHIDKDWLGTQDKESFDGFFSSNVIDVIPLELAKEIIKNSAHVLKKGSKAVFSLNYYIDPEIMKNKGCETDGRNIYMEGVLRLSSLTDEEWSCIFSEYYEISKLEHYSWPGETKETRRLFTLIKK